MKEAQSHYEVLGVDRRATAAEIKAARGRRIAQWHPDKYVNRTSLERQNAEYQFKRVLEAYDVLGDPHLRERYDRECERKRSRSNRPAASSPPLVSPGTVVLCEHSILTGTLWKVIVGEKPAGELVALQNSAKSIGGRWELRGHVSTSDVRAASARANSLFSRWSHPDFVCGEGSLIIISTEDDDIAFTSAVNDGWDWDKFENHVAYARPSRDVGELDRRIKSGFGPQHPTHKRVRKIASSGFLASFAFASLFSLLVIPMPSFGESETAFEPAPHTAPEEDVPPISEDSTSSGVPAEPACGTSEALPRYRDLPGWSGYRCMRRELVPAVWASCLPRSAYSHTEGAGCPGRQLCCQANDEPVIEGDLAAGDNTDSLPEDERVGRSDEVEAADRLSRIQPSGPQDDRLAALWSDLTKHDGESFVNPERSRILEFSEYWGVVPDSRLAVSVVFHHDGSMVQLFTEGEEACVGVWSIASGSDGLVLTIMTLDACGVSGSWSTVFVEPNEHSSFRRAMDLTPSDGGFVRRWYAYGDAP